MMKEEVEEVEEEEERQSAERRSSKSAKERRSLPPPPTLLPPPKVRGEEESEKLAGGLSSTHHRPRPFHPSNQKFACPVKPHRSRQVKSRQVTCCKQRKDVDNFLRLTTYSLLTTQSWSYPRGCYFLTHWIKALGEREMRCCCGVG